MALLTAVVAVSREVPLSFSHWNCHCTSIREENNMCYVYGTRHSWVCEGSGVRSVKELGSVPAKVEPSDQSRFIK